MTVYLDSQDVSENSWIRETTLAMEELSLLPKNWNSEESQKIKPLTIQLMLALLLRILHNDAITPSVVPTPRGGVQVEWHRKNIDFEIEMFPSGEAEFLYISPTCFLDDSVNDIDHLQSLASSVTRP